MNNVIQYKNQDQIHKHHDILSPFSIITIFAALILIGICSIPLLSIQLSPSRTNAELSISFQWPNASARVIEQEVTSKLEGLLGGIEGIQDIKSITSKGRGKINLTFKKKTDLDILRFEIATLIRRVYHKLPENVSYPLISPGASGQRSQPVLTYTLTGEGSAYEIQEYAHEHIEPRLSMIKGVQEIAVFGASSFEWEISINYDLCNNLGISVEEVEVSIQKYFERKEIGLVSTRGKDKPSMTLNSTLMQASEPVQLQMRLSLEMYRPSELNWHQIPVKNVEGRVIHLTDVSSVKYVEQQPNSYFRVNGLSAINIVIYPTNNVNQIELSDELNYSFNLIRKSLPPYYSLFSSYDASKFIKDEIRKLCNRAIFSLLILLVFLFLISRQLRYMIVILLSLVANLSIAFPLYYLFDVAIHIYSLAGITVSFGIIIDNAIVMVAHYAYYKNKKILLAILASTVTTIGALSVVFFLDEGQKINLFDFALVVIINLGSSLIIAYFFVPALMQIIPRKSFRSRNAIRRKKLIFYFNNKYYRAILIGRRFRWFFILLIVFGFGLPVQWLPEKIELGDNIWITLYNQTIGSDWYQTSAKPLAEKLIGGSLRLFTEYVFENSFYQETERTTLYVQGSMPEGCTVKQLNDAVEKMEKYVSKFDQVQIFQTSIESYRNSSIAITFKPEYEYGGFPHSLKDSITSLAISLGGVDWNVHGVGRGFSNALSTGFRNSSIKLEGYNYDHLYSIAEKLRNRMLENPRIKEIDIQGGQVWETSNLHEYYLKFDQAILARENMGLATLYKKLSDKVYNHSLPPVFNEAEVQAVRLVTSGIEPGKLWQFNNLPFEIKETRKIGDKQIRLEGTGDSWSKEHQNVSMLKLHQLASVDKRKSGNDIYKSNQQYQLYLLYDFIGPGKFSQAVREDFIENIKPSLPMGYGIEDGYQTGGFWDKKIKSQYYLIFLIIAIVYAICSILLESLLQPLSVIAMIPLSFIGVFLTFYLFDLNFDQGGFASFFFLGGISVNSSLYILNDFNNFKKRKFKGNEVRMYVGAFNQKIFPIFLTTTSTVLGLIPFLIEGQNEVFWFSFASGTIGGLVFSSLVLVVYLPLFLPLRLAPTA